MWSTHSPGQSRGSARGRSPTANFFGPASSRLGAQMSRYSTSYWMGFFWEWISEQFLQLACFMKILHLHVTTFLQLQVTHWKMKLYPKGDTPEAAGYLSVYLSNQVCPSVYLLTQVDILELVLSLPCLLDRDRSEGKIRVHNFRCLQE